MCQALERDDQVPDGVHPGITSLLILGQQVQHRQVGGRAEDQGESSLVIDVFKPEMMKGKTTLYFSPLTCLYSRYPLSC